MRVQWRQSMRTGATLAAAAVLAWLARTRTALARAALIRVAMVVEDGVRLLQVAGLRLFRGSTAPLLVPFLGHGSSRSVHVGARAVLGRPGAAARRLVVPDEGVLAPVGPAEHNREPRSRRAVLRTSLNRFLTVEAVSAPVTVRTPGAEVTVRSDRDGYVDVV